MQRKHCSVCQFDTLERLTHSDPLCLSPGEQLHAGRTDSPVGGLRSRPHDLRLAAPPARS